MGAIQFHLGTQGNDNLSLQNEPKISQTMRKIESSNWRKQHMQRSWGRQEDADIKSAKEENGMCGEQRVQDHSTIHVLCV